nr:hypothetical protein [Tsukamurella sp. PLM1]
MGGQQREHRAHAVLVRAERDPPIPLGELATTFGRFVVEPIDDGIRSLAQRGQGHHLELSREPLVQRRVVLTYLFGSERTRTAQGRLRRLRGDHILPDQPEHLGHPFHEPDRGLDRVARRRGPHPQERGHLRVERFLGGRQPPPGLHRLRVLAGTRQIRRLIIGVHHPVQGVEPRHRPAVRDVLRPAFFEQNRSDRALFTPRTREPQGSRSPGRSRSAAGSAMPP